MTLTGKVLLGLTALGIATFAVTEALARSLPKSSAAPTPTPAPSPTPSHPKGRAYAGSGWTGWPHKDVFPDLDALVQALLRLGYPVSENLLSASSMAAVGQFQDDYNLWAVMFRDQSLGTSVQEWPAQPGSTIDADDLVGTETVEAMYDAMLADENFPGGWPALVAWYRARA